MQDEVKKGLFDVLDRTTAADQATQAATVIFDLDRTLTRVGSYTPFLWSCIRLTPRTIGRIAWGLGVLAVHARKLTKRDPLKAHMVNYSILGASRVQVAAWSAKFVSRWLRHGMRPGALAAIERHRAAGHRLVLVTASFDFYAQVFGDRLGFHHVIATESVWDSSGRLMAALGSPNCYGPAKLAAVQAYFGKTNPRPYLIAYSDHHSDFDLLCWADEGVAVNPSAALRRLAETQKLTTVDWS